MSSTPSRDDPKMLHIGNNTMIFSDLCFWADPLCSSCMWLCMIYLAKWWAYSAVWLLRGWCRVKLLWSWRPFFVHHTTIHQFTVTLYLKPHIGHMVACVFSCNLPPALLAECLASFTCYCGNMGPDGMDTKIRISTESWPLRRKFSWCSCRESNTHPFSHGSVTLLPSYRCSCHDLVNSAWPVSQTLRECSLKWHEENNIKNVHLRW